MPPERSHTRKGFSFSRTFHAFIYTDLLFAFQSRILLFALHLQPLPRTDDQELYGRNLRVKVWRLHSFHPHPSISPYLASRARHRRDKKTKRKSRELVESAHSGYTYGSYPLEKREKADSTSGSLFALSLPHSFSFFWL